MSAVRNEHGPLAPPQGAIGGSTIRFNTSRVVNLTDATYTVTAEESGNVFTLSRAGGIAVTLPLPYSGLRYKFIVAVAPTTSCTLTTAGDTPDIFHGVVTSAEDAAGSVDGTGGTATDVVTIVANNALAGDYVELIANGTYWFVSGACNVQDAISFD